MERLAGQLVIGGAIMIAAAAMSTRGGATADVSFSSGIILTIAGLGLVLKFLGQEGKTP